ncbi:MAG TPA: hypothetical protein VNK95_02350 [Caldilineaceae bacterium]|nr:hypothetical protein [Caldilineaceae bacterium]
MAETRAESKTNPESDPAADAKAGPKGGRAPRRQVAADLVETTPESGGLFHWVLASPMLLFIAWVWVDLFAHFSPIPNYWVDALLGLALMVLWLVLPAGTAAFWLVTSLPRLFHHAGWNVQPLEPVTEAEAPWVRYVYRRRLRAKSGWRRIWLRAAQGWVFLEIAAIFAGGVLMIPLFFSAVEFGFGQR